MERKTIRFGAVVTDTALASLAKPTDSRAGRATKADELLRKDLRDIGIEGLRDRETEGLKEGEASALCWFRLWLFIEQSFSLTIKV
tara:strand:- start:5305 stop:5562 length:258 start_codon:yes stop_codon:yes gene_type:complete